MIDWLLGFGVGILVMDVFWFLILRRSWKKWDQFLKTSQEVLALIKKVNNDLMAQAEKLREVEAQAEKAKEEASRP